MYLKDQSLVFETRSTCSDHRAKTLIQLQTRSLSDEQMKLNKYSTRWSETVAAIADTNQVVALYSIPTQFMVRPSAYCSVYGFTSRGCYRVLKYCVSQSNSIFSKMLKLIKCSRQLFSLPSKNANPINY